MQKKEVLLLNLPFDRPVIRDYGCPHGVKADYYWPPIDLLIFGAIVRNHASLSYIDAIAGNRSVQSVLEAVETLQPDAIMTMLSSITLESDLGIISEIRRRSPKTGIWAAGDVVFFSNADIPGIDYHIRDLTNSAAIAELWQTDPGRGNIEKNAGAEFSIGICPHELTRQYAYAMPYSLHSGITSVMTNYGCPFSCVFCNSNLLGFKRRRVAEIIEELLFIQDLGIREILIRDFTFNMSDADLICDEIFRNRISLKWSCWTSASLVDREILLKMKAAGCYLISYGVESGDELVLTEACRPAGLEQIRAAVSLTRAAGIEALTSFIVGFPGEDRNKTLSFLTDLDPDYLSLNILAPRLGTGMSANQTEENRPNSTDSLLSSDELLLKFRDRTERAFFLRPARLLRYLILSLKSPRRLIIFLKNGFALIRRWQNPSRQS